MKNAIGMIGAVLLLGASTLAQASTMTLDFTYSGNLFPYYNTAVVTGSVTLDTTANAGLPWNSINGLNFGPPITDLRMLVTGAGAGNGYYSLVDIPGAIARLDFEWNGPIAPNLTPGVEIVGQQTGWNFNPTFGPGSGSLDKFELHFFVSPEISSLLPTADTNTTWGDYALRTQGLWGPETRNVVLTSLKVGPQFAPPAVPLPAAGWLLLSGVGGVAALARRRKSSVTLRTDR